jgi:hypothetical protein
MLLVVIEAAAACSRATFEEQLGDRAKALPRRFEVNGRGYLLNDQQAGVVDDDSVSYTADAGARTFHFDSRIVVRHFFAGTSESFDSIPKLKASS